MATSLAVSIPGPRSVASTAPTPHNPLDKSGQVGNVQPPEKPSQKRDDEDNAVDTLVSSIEDMYLDEPMSQALENLEQKELEESPKMLTLEEQAELEAKEAEKAKHSAFMEEALEMARLALRTNETPVGCVLVYKDRIIAKGMNATNVTRCGIRHAEYMALGALLSHLPMADVSTPIKDPPEWSDFDPTGCYLWPYGQKLHPSPVVDPTITKECTLYVTVEPCVMCASMLRQYGIKKVYFGAVNDKFGGTGGVFRVHINSLPATSNAVRMGRAAGRNNPHGTPSEARDPTDGDGGNVEQGFEAEGGWSRDEAVALLRRFYVQENGRAPVPRKKEGRAARLAALMEKDGASLPAYLVPNTEEAGSVSGTSIEIRVDDQHEDTSCAISQCDTTGMSETPKQAAGEAEGSANCVVSTPPVAIPRPKVATPLIPLPVPARPAQ